jgi:hypothetical protein
LAKIRARVRKTSKDKRMAEPVTLTATTLEGQAIQIIEALSNAQTAAIIAAGTGGAAVKRIVTSNVSDEIGGVKSVTLSFPINTVASATGLETTAAVVY